MKGLRTLTTYALALLFLATFVSQTRSAPKDSFQRRNWTPQAMLYLKGAQGRRFVSEDRKEGDVYDTIHLETRSQNTEQRRGSQAASLLLDFLQQAREEGAIPRTVHALFRPQHGLLEFADENQDQVYFQDLPAWKREYFK